VNIFGNATIGGALGISGAATFSGGMAGTLTGHATLDLPLTGGTVTGHTSFTGELTASSEFQANGTASFNGTSTTVNGTLNAIGGFMWRGNTVSFPGSGGTLSYMAGGVTNGDCVTWSGTNGAQGDSGTPCSTVTSASVVTANGFYGSVATSTTTPAITLGTTVTGLLKGNGTAIGAAAAGVDYLAPTGSGASLTGITSAQVGGLGALATLDAAPAGTLTGAALPNGVTGSSLTSVGTLTSGAIGSGFTAISNSALANSSATINGQNCTLGASCTAPAAAGTLTGSTLASGVTGSSLTSVGTLTALSGAQTGVFTNTQGNVPFSVVLNGLNPATEFSNAQAGNNATNAFTAAMAIPSGSTVYQANGIASFISNSSITTLGVSGFFAARSTLTGGKIWGINEDINDGGFASTLMADEVDVNISNASTVSDGLSVTATFTAHATNTSAVAINSSSTYPWGWGFISNDGAATIGLWLGSVAKYANSDSQAEWFWARDNSNISQSCAIQGIHQIAGENLQLYCTSGNITVFAPLAMAASGLWTANGSTVLSLTGLGPSGANSTVQEWFTVTDAGGIVRYIPAF
jgi:hypothetical protein